MLTVVKPGQDAPAGFLVAGVSPHLQFDDDYGDFMHLVAGQVAAAVAEARAYEEERRRAVALAELDRAKTYRFSNVSHEFRTPLTSMLSPVEEILCEDVTTGECVFRRIRTGGRINDIKKGFVSACLAAGIRNFTSHDLRHTWSSRAAEMGVPEHARRDILGHSASSMTGDSTHASPEEMERAMELVASYAGREFFGLGKISANPKTAAESPSAAAS